jgi:ubiquinone/menaquinone biosynthesis C-methylase UbiE
VLDVGCGDGLVAFGAIDRVGEGGRVIFSDVSQDLIQARAEDLSPIHACSVDAVTTRSVLIYVSTSAGLRGIRRAAKLAVRWA